MVNGYLFGGGILDSDNLDKYKKLMLHGLSNMDHVTFGIFLDELVLKGNINLDDIIEGHPLAEGLYQRWQAEQIQLANTYSIYEKNNNGCVLLKKWENGPI
mgnify:FL=1